MSLFRRHKWQIAGASFTEPTNVGIEGYSGPADIFNAHSRRAYEGVTHVYLRCEACGDLKEIDLYGKFTPAGNDQELDQLRKMVQL